MSEPLSDHELPLDPGIAVFVEVLRAGGIETYESCEGGPGHSYPEPMVGFYGGPGEGERAVAIAAAADLPVSEVRRVWAVCHGRLAPSAVWEMTFSAAADTHPQKAEGTSPCHEGRRGS